MREIFYFTIGADGLLQPVILGIVGVVPCAIQYET